MAAVTALCFIATFSTETNNRFQSHYEQKYSVNHEEYFETNSATVIQGISTIFTVEMPLQNFQQFAT